jgi:AGZA family xanthine/uracil permease-like MFS transporter
MLDRAFKLSENNTSVRTELVAGLTTFLTMSYIIFVQPAVLSGNLFNAPTGMDQGAITVATCLSAALATALMGVYARYPIALAPGMGQNFFFVFTMLPGIAALGHPNAWPVALGCVFLSGVFFLVLSLLGIREKLIDAVSPSLKQAIAAGIGLFIAFIGVQNAGLVLKHPGTAVRLNTQFASPDLILFFAGLLLIAALEARRVRGAILWGILGATALAALFKSAVPLLPETWQAADAIRESGLVNRFAVASAVVSRPPSIEPTFFKMDLLGALSAPMLPFVVIVLFMDMFDTIGTLIGVSERAGLIKDNQLPRARQALTSDAAATLVGACLGTSTVTSYIESAAGVEQGGRTGLTSLTVAALFLLALFFSPVIAMIGSYPAITAPSLVVVGCLMMQNIVRIDWSDYTESIPCFLTVIGIPFSFNIGDGLALGFISYPLVKLLAGRGREVRGLTYVLGAVLLAYFVFIRARIG